MPQNEGKTSRIKDIAALAGVSIGTVDRVLHNRGDVSDHSRAKVEQAMEALDYKPNIYASALAQNRVEHKIIYLIPHHSAGSYWSEIETGIKEAAADMAHLNLNVEALYFDQYNPDSFTKLTEYIVEIKPKAILFPPIFGEESISFTKTMNQAKIPFSLFDSCIDVDNMVSFFGQDAFASGNLAFRLLQLHTERGSHILIFHSHRDSNRWSTQSTARRAGFNHALSKNMKNGYNIETIDVPMTNETEAKTKIKEALREQPNSKAIVIFNSRSYLIADTLREISHQDITIIGFDALERNVEALKEGYISALIGQHPKLQGYRSFKSLCDCVILKQNIEKKNYMPLDILIAENIDDYKSFKFK